MKSKPLSQYKQHQFPLKDIGGTWYKKILKKLTPLRKHKRIKNAQDKDYEIKRNLQTANRNWND